MASHRSASLLQHGRARPQYDLPSHDAVAIPLKVAMNDRGLKFAAMQRLLGTSDSFFHDGHPRLALRWRYFRWVHNEADVDVVPPQSILLHELKRYSRRQKGKLRFCNGDVPNTPEGRQAAAAAIAAFS